LLIVLLFCSGISVLTPTLPGYSFSITQIIHSTGDGTHALNSPEGIATDPSGNVFVTGYISNNAFKITGITHLTLNIISPTNGSFTSKSTIHVTGNATDNNSVNFVSWRVDNGPVNIANEQPAGFLTPMHCHLEYILFRLTPQILRKI
jgi:hypothetical protein